MSFRDSELFKESRKATLKSATRDKNINARVLDDDEEPKDSEYVHDGVAFEVKSNAIKNTINFQNGETMTDEQLMFGIQAFQENERHEKEEMSDDYIEVSYSNLTSVATNATLSQDDVYPDGWSRAYYPAGKLGMYGQKEGKKPRKDVIERWVKDVKLANMSQDELENEYKKIYNVKQVKSWDKSKMDNLTTSIAYLVARKIWYVGRKPAGLDPDKWDEMTADMRPEQGTFSQNESWVNGFPYGREYTYSSGTHDYH